MQRKKLLIVGAGRLCLQILQVLAPRNQFEFHVATRDLEKATRLCNLVRQAALQLNVVVQIRGWAMDLRAACIGCNAETLSKIKPDIILNCASLQSTSELTALDREKSDALDRVGFGPWLPLHLAPAYALMRAVKQSCPKALVVNAAYPDAVNAVLYKVGMAPDVGIGNIANLVPATRCAIARLSGSDPVNVCVKLVGHHYFSQYVPRFGLPVEASEPDCSLSYWIDGHEYTDEWSEELIFGCVADEFRRLGGADAHYLTAMSAVAVLENLYSDIEVRVHAPGPHGLPGGYPIKVGMGKVLLDLPFGVRREAAIQVNEAGQRQDGIQSILADGTVVFGDRQCELMRKVLNFRMTDMKVSDAAEWARELACRFRAYAQDTRQPSTHIAVGGYPASAL